MSKVLVISTSLHAFSNSESLAKEFALGAEAAGNEVEMLSLKDKQLAFCQGCLACQKIGHCVINDYARIVADKALQADVLCFATPLYYYEMSGQMKTLLDRLNPLFNLNYKFRKVYMLISAAEDEPAITRRAVNGLKGWIECFPSASYAGSVFAGGVTAGGEIACHEALKRAYNLGKKII